MTTVMLMQFVQNRMTAIATGLHEEAVVTTQHNTTHNPCG